METLQEEYTERDKIYYKNLPAWPEFDIYDKNVDGLMPAAYVETWEQFHSVVKSYRSDEEGSEYIFRGQHNYEWELQPTLDRMTPGSIQKDIAKKQLRNFRLSIRGRVPNNSVVYEREEELWAVGQHHGLATPLLDWTLAPYVALFFAFVNEDHQTWKDDDEKPTNHSRVIYILNKSFVEDLVEDEEADPLDNGYPKVVEPSKDDHGRLVNQAGLFTIAPYGETIESALLKALADSEVDVDNSKELSKYICKLHIPNTSEIRRDCLRHLRKMNIHHASLFPDVIGASGYCNELISEAIENQRRSGKPVVKKLVEKIVAPTFTEKDFVVKETDDVINKVIEALIVDESIKGKLSEKSLKTVAKTAIEFIDNKAGVDWFVRESQISRLKVVVRRHLKKIDFPDDFLADAAHSLVFCVAKMSYEKDREEGLKKGTVIESDREENVFDKVWSEKE